MRADAPRVADQGTEADTSEAVAHSGVSVAATVHRPTGRTSPNRPALATATWRRFAESDVVIEHTYRIPMVHQGYLEPHAALVEWDAAGS